MSIRREFVLLALSPQANISALCRAFSISRKTAYKWMDRYAHEGADGLQDRSRRPHDSPQRSAAKLEKQILALHATYRMVNWDGCGAPLAGELSERCGYPVTGDMGYPTPGSFGAKYGIENNLEVITIEVPYLDVDEQAWLDCRTALRWCVDLPD